MEFAVAWALPGGWLVCTLAVIEATVHTRNTLCWPLFVWTFGEVVLSTALILHRYMAEPEGSRVHVDTTWELQIGAAGGQFVLLVLETLWNRMYFWPWEASGEASDNDGECPSPRTGANTISAWTFSWVIPLLFKGVSKESITFDDLPNTPDRAYLEQGCESFLEDWERRVAEDESPSLLNAVMKQWGVRAPPQAIRCMLLCCTLQARVYYRVRIEARPAARVCMFLSKRRWPGPSGLSHACFVYRVCTRGGFSCKPSPVHLVTSATWYHRSYSGKSSSTSTTAQLPCPWPFSTLYLLPCLI